MPVASETYF